MNDDSKARARHEIRSELIDAIDEELEMELDDQRAAEFAALSGHRIARASLGCRASS